MSWFLILSNDTKLEAVCFDYSITSSLAAKTNFSPHSSARVAVLSNDTKLEAVCFDYSITLSLAAKTNIMHKETVLHKSSTAFLL